ncbi:MAG: aspartate-semialdehyde dehydrogenase [Verrucomicrobiales bacterium]|jgi:aspartate-semialdehyde dehydrogenase
MSSPKHIAIAGATGAVGVEMLKCLEERDFPIASLRLLASARSKGKPMTFRGEQLLVEELTKDSFGGIDIALFSAGSGISKQFAKPAVGAGAVVVDNSSAFRMDEGVPLVVPEINGADAQNHNGVIANPNCTTIVTLMGLNPLHKAWGARKIIASSYQSVSGSGQAGITELDNQIKAIVKGEPIEKNVYWHQIASNVIPEIGGVGPNGYTSEEMKMQNEGRKILHTSGLLASVTCVRVPVHRSHSIAATVEFERTPSVEEARKLIEAAPGVGLIDDDVNNRYPTPLDSTDGDDCFVGRIRRDLVFENGLSFFVVGDQVRKGAALNAVQIAELL